MRLQDRQQIFTKNVGLFIEKARELGIGLTMGEAQRTHSQGLLNYHGYDVIKCDDGTIGLKKRRATSKTMASKHFKRLAIDFNYFINGRLTYNKKELQKLGDYWESLHPANSWGGNWKSFVDTPHIQMDEHD